MDELQKPEDTSAPMSTSTFPNYLNFVESLLPSLGCKLIMLTQPDWKTLLKNSLNGLMFLN